MNKRRFVRQFGAVLGVAAMLPFTAANAGFLVGDESLLGEWEFAMKFNAFLRSETAINITGDPNVYNQRGNIFNGVTVKRTGSLLGFGGTLLTDTVTRQIRENDDKLLNLQFFRFEANLNFALFENLRFESKLRAIWDPDLYNNFDPDRYEFTFLNNVGQTYGEPNLFEYTYQDAPATFYAPRYCRMGHELACEPANANEWALLDRLGSEEGSTPFEWAGRQYLIDFPQFYFEYAKGGLFIRAGMQQIAWGDLLFFRVIDVPNALDLRRHSILDLASEEFADKRLSALGIRASYLWHGWKFEAYVQRFRSTILPNPNTPYNVIPSQFTVHDVYGLYQGELNYGIRIQGQIGPFGITLMANRRYNPLGTFHWTDSDKPIGLHPLSPQGYLSGTSGLGGLPELLQTLGLAGVLDPVAGVLAGATGAALADSPFGVDVTGVTSADEFQTYGALARLNHFTGLNQAIKYFAGSRQLGAVTTNSPAFQESQEDAFFQLSGGLRGHIYRRYWRENNFGVSIDYKFTGPPTSIFFDQILFSLEMKYTPSRHYTPTNLHPFKAIEDDELEIGLVAEKFVRWSAGFPAAYAVLQYLYRSESDIFKRHLSGYSGDPDADTARARLPDGISHYQLIALAIQQPFPGRIFRADLAILWDLKGGILVQPAFRWTPNSRWRVQIFANFIETIYGNPTANSLSTVDFADELTIRVTYYF